MSGRERRHGATRGREVVGDHGTMVEAELLPRRESAPADSLRNTADPMRATAEREAALLLDALTAKEHELRRLKAELDAYDAIKSAPVPYPVTTTAIDPAMQADAYRELLSRTESAHVRFEHLRISIENLASRMDVSFAKVVDLLETGRAAHRSGFVDRYGRAVFAAMLALVVVLSLHFFSRL